MAVIKTALLSFGMSGKIFHAPFLAIHPGFLLAGAWERSTKNIQAIYPGTTSYQSLDEILNDASIELVVVNTPTNTHFEYTRKVLLAGKHAIVEKAFTTTVQEAIELKELAEKTGKKITVYQNRRWDSDCRTLQKIINSGVLGTLVEASLYFDRYKPAPGPKQHKELPGPGAGLLNDLGPHLIDQALCHFGMPEAIFADIKINRPNALTDDWFDITLFYPTLRARLKSTMFCREAVPAFVLHGTSGSFIKKRGDIQEAELLAGKTPNTSTWGIESENTQGLLHTEINGSIVRQQVPSEQGNYYYFFDEVHKAIVNNSPMPVTAADGIKIMQLLEAAVQSNAGKCVVYLKQ
jgi:scyllo-inositol 2-dehydrogenase (NADP+)